MWLQEELSRSPCLTCKLFSLEDMTSSNLRGILNKRKLDYTKTSAIRRACIGKFPPKQHETSRAVDRKIREGIDEMCCQKSCATD